MEGWPTVPKGEDASGDAPVHCELCGLDTSAAMIAQHLAEVHGVDPEDIASAPIIDRATGEVLEFDEDED